MKRPLAFATAFFSLALVCAFQLSFNADYVIAALLFVAAVVCVFCHTRARAALLCALFSLSLGFALMGLALDERYEQVTYISGRTVSAKATVTEKTEYDTFDIIVLRLDECDGDKIRNVNGRIMASSSLNVGDKISAVITFDEIKQGASAFKNTDSELDCSLESIDGFNGQDKFIVICDSIRRYITRALLATLPNIEQSGLCIGVITGDRSYVSTELREAMSRAGDSHILAVSGLHITFLLGMLLGFLRRIRPHTVIGFLIVIPAAVLCSGFYGVTPSVVRACVMAVFSFGADFVNRKNDPVTSLSFAAMLILLQNPLSIGNASFLLSFSCCVAITVVYPAVKARIIKIDNINALLKPFISIVDSLILSTTISLVTLPVCAAIGLSFSIFSPIVNVPVLLLAGPLLASSALIPLTALLSALSPIRMLLGLVAGVCSNLILSVSRAASSLSFASVSTGALWVKIWLCFCCLFLATAYILQKVNRGEHYLTAIVCCVVMFLFGSVSFMLATEGYPRVITYADSIIIDDNKTSIIIDSISANGEVRLSSYLKQRGINEVDTVCFLNTPKDEALSSVTSFMGCDEVTYADRYFDSEQMTLHFECCSVIINRDNTLTIKGHTGTQLDFTPAGYGLSGFDIIGNYGGRTTVISESSSDYHASDVTIYLNTSKGFTAVDE